jgi:hypothetical protein
MNAEIFHNTLFVVGVVSSIFSIWRGYFTIDLLLQELPLIGVLVASYLWIREDIWRSKITIQELAKDNQTVRHDLISRKADFQIAFLFLCLVALAQFFYLSWPNEKMVFVSLLFFLVPAGNWAARWRLEILRRWSAT